MIKKEPTKKQITVFVFGLDIICLLFMRKAIIHDNILIAYSLGIFITVLTFMFFIKRKFVIQFYHHWMKVVGCIGMTITSIIMIFLFYLIFAPVGLFIKLMGKDLLNSKLNPEASSYWIDKHQKPFNKEDYEKQY